MPGISLFKFPQLVDIRELILYYTIFLKTLAREFIYCTVVGPKY